MGGWPHTEINLPHQELNQYTATHLSTNRAPTLIIFIDRSQRANHYARLPPFVTVQDETELQFHKNVIPQYMWPLNSTDLNRVNYN